MHRLIIIAFDGAGAQPQIRGLQHQILRRHGRVHHQAVDKTVLASPALRFRQIACYGDNDRRLSGKSGTEGVDVPHQLRIICHKEAPGLQIAGCGGQSRSFYEYFQNFPGNRFVREFPDTSSFFDYFCQFHMIFLPIYKRFRLRMHCPDKALSSYEYVRMLLPKQR